MKDTLASILGVAAEVAIEAHPDHTRLARMSDWLIDNLAIPIGADVEYPSTEDGRVVVSGRAYPVAEARALAALILLEADAAES